MIFATLDRKLLRDLKTMQGQLVTIALVVASGIAAFVCTQSAVDSLADAQQTFYTEQRFADAWVHLKRAPESIHQQLQDVPGVATVQTRVVGTGAMPMPGMSEPAQATVVSLPRGTPLLNDVFLRRGRRPMAGRDDEVLLSDAFASAHGVEPGDRIPLVLGGVRRDVRVVGIALSPEYVMVLSVGDISVDDRRRGVVFMDRQVVAAALDLEGSFNDVAVRLMPGADDLAVLDGIDRIVERYGGTGAYLRERQISHFVLSQELAQLENMTKQVPPLFLFVAAFLLHVVLSRLVQLQRPQIAALKALGYSNRTIGVHYLKLASLIVVMGATLGIVLGRWFGDGLVDLYATYFRFPVLEARVDRETAAIAIVVSVGAAAVGTLTSVRSVLKLAPAEAMRPQAPARYRRGLLDRLGSILPPAAQMVFREVQRRPVRLALSSLGIAVAVGMMVVASFMTDAMAYLVDVQLHESQRWDVQVTFAQPRPASTLRSFRHLPGVFLVEGTRMVPVRMRHRHRERSVAITGYADDAQMLRVLDMEGTPAPIPDEGLLMTKLLGELLDLDIGDRVEVEVLEGDRRTLHLPVAGFVEEPFGLQVHMRTSALHRALDQQPSVSTAQLRVDPSYSGEIDSRLAELPDVVGITHKTTMIREFREQSAKNMRMFSLIMTLFAATIAIGVVYNNARVSLSMRRRDLASLRVLGFTRGEISSVLLGELAIQVLLAIPIGLLFGNAMAGAMMDGADPEMYRMPVIVSARTYAMATVITLGSALVSALLVRRKLDRLDLIGVLKTRE